MILGAINVDYFGEETACEKQSVLKLVLHFHILNFFSKFNVLYYIGKQPLWALSSLKHYKSVTC